MNISHTTPEPHIPKVFLNKKEGILKGSKCYPIIAKINDGPKVVKMSPKLEKRLKMLKKQIQEVRNRK